VFDELIVVPVRMKFELTVKLLTETPLKKAFAPEPPRVVVRLITGVLITVFAVIVLAIE
jgi:hypothetical protein